MSQGSPGPSPLDPFFGSFFPAKIVIPNAAGDPGRPFCRALVPARARRLSPGLDRGGQNVCFPLRRTVKRPTSNDLRPTGARLVPAAGTACKLLDRSLKSSNATAVVPPRYRCHPAPRRQNDTPSGSAPFAPFAPFAPNFRVQNPRPQVQRTARPRPCRQPRLSFARPPR